MNHVLALGSIVLSGFVIGLSGAMMPGPLLAVTLTETARRGAIAGPLIVLGHMILEASLVVALVLGLARFLNQPAAIGLISFVGGAVLCWMGQDMFRSAARIALPGAGAPAQSRMHPVTAGIVVSLSNPYWTLWWATTGIACLAMGMRFGLPGVAAFFVGHILADLGWYSLVSVGVAGGRRILSGTVYRTLISACGLVLLGFGLWFFWAGGVALWSLLAAPGPTASSPA